MLAYGTILLVLLVSTGVLLDLVVNAPAWLIVLVESMIGMANILGFFEAKRRPQ